MMSLKKKKKKVDLDLHECFFQIYQHVESHLLCLQLRT